VWYLLKVDALVAVCVFTVAGLIILGLNVWEQAKALAAARRFFANPFRISRSVSRTESGDQLRSPQLQ
jgi:hypothetical protein